MCNNKITEIRPLIPIMHSIESLIWLNGIGPDFEELVSQMVNVKSLCIFTDDYRPYQNSMTIDQMQYLFFWLTSNGQIEDLSLPGYRLGGVSNLFTFVTNCRSIRSMRFSKNLEHFVLQELMRTIITNGTRLRKLSVVRYFRIYEIELMYQRAMKHSKTICSLIRALHSAEMSDTPLGQAVSLYPFVDMVKSSLGCIPEDFIFYISDY
jgi:hypothetical protein